jgi:BBSome-interacting protein 1
MADGGFGAPSSGSAGGGGAGGAPAPGGGGARPVLREVLPKAGLVYSEKGHLTEVLCKPKLLPIKSATLEKIERLEREAAAALQSAAPR